MNREQMLARQQELVDTARNEGRGLTPAEEAEFQRLQGDIARADAGGGAGGGAGGADGASGGATGADGAEGDTGGTDEARILQGERQRISDIVALGAQTGLDVVEHIRSGATMDTVRGAALNHVIAYGTPIRAGMSNRSEMDDFQRDASDALLMMTGANVADASENAHQYRGMGLRDLAIECLSRDGQGTTSSLLRMSRSDLYDNLQRQFYNPTSAFPAILDNTIKKSLVTQYTAVPTTFQQWTAKGSVTDFKPTKEHNYLAGGAGEFKRVTENGELKADKPGTELLPQRQIHTYGRSFSMTREAFINDDVGFITEMPGMYATAAKRTINKAVYSILVNNPAIYDGTNLFSSAHANLISTGCAPSGDAVQAMMMAMLMQKDQFGESIMVQPRHIVVPVGYKFLMTSILFSPTIQTTDNTQAVNPLYDYRSNINVVEDATINALVGTGTAPWFMVADQSYAKSIQIDYLNGQETPTVRRSEQARTLGFTWDIFLDWGATVIDYRGINKNPGIAMTSSL